MKCLTIFPCDILMVFHMPCPTNLYNLRTLKPPSKLDNTDNSSFIINSSSASLTGRFRDNNPVYAIIIKLNVWFIPSIATRKNGAVCIFGVLIRYDIRRTIAVNAAWLYNNFAVHQLRCWLYSNFLLVAVQYRRERCWAVYQLCCYLYGRFIPYYWLYSLEENAD